MPTEAPDRVNTAPAPETDRYVVSVTLYSADRFRHYLCPAPPPRVGTPVVVETERGICLGWVRLKPRPATRGDIEKLHPIIRIATENDLLQEDRNREREAHAFRVCLNLVQRHGLDMKLVRVHYLLGGNKAVFYFTADGRVDFRALVRDLASELRIRVEMRQIGVRDETKMRGGVGHCGRQLCCAGWLRSFVPVSIRMAKDQNLALNPQKVSGACGRLMCCLAFEHESYVTLRRGLPKVGKRVQTIHGQARVISIEVLKQAITVELADGKRLQIGREELLTPQPAPSASSSGTKRSERSPREDGKKSAGTPSQGKGDSPPRKGQTTERNNKKRNRRNRRRRSGSNDGT